MSSSEGGGSSGEQQGESVEYSGEKGDGVVYLIFGVISIVVIVVIVLLVVFLMNRPSAHTSEPQTETSFTGGRCTNPCGGSGRVCQPDSKRDADGCFVQDCHCYTPDTPYGCSNPCNATGQVCHFNSPLDEHGCYLPSCQCVTCPQDCPVDKKCDPNSPAGPDGCPMLGCTCVPMICPARCPAGRQCAPHAPTDSNGCFEHDCMCVPVTVAPPPSWTTVSKACPMVCPVGKKCHKLQPVDASGCPVAPCTCISESCPTQCPAGEICDLTAPLDAAGCFKNGCKCVPDGATLPPSRNTPATVSAGGDSSTPAPQSSVTTDSTQPAVSGRRALAGDTNGTHSEDGVPVLKRSPQLPNDANGSSPHSSAGEAEGVREEDDTNGSGTKGPEETPGGEPRASDEGTATQDSSTGSKDTGGTTEMEPVQTSTRLEEGIAPQASSVAPQGLPSDSDATKSPGPDESGGPSEEPSNSDVTKSPRPDESGGPSEQPSDSDVTKSSGPAESEGPSEEPSGSDVTKSPGPDESGGSSQQPSDSDVTKSPGPDEPGGTSEESAKVEAIGVASSEQVPPEDGDTAASGESASAVGAAEGEVEAESAAAGEEPAGAEAAAGASSAEGAVDDHGEPRVRRSFRAAGAVLGEPKVITVGKAEANGAFDAFNMARKMAEALFKNKSRDHSAATKEVPLLIVPSGDPSSPTFVALVTRKSTPRTNQTGDRTI
ncbi:uncharacterized protein LOC144119139 isoform X2 [Amblyomma americanum]